MAETEKPKTVSIYMPPKLRRSLENEAHRQTRSVSNLIVIILQKHFRSELQRTEAEHGK